MRQGIVTLVLWCGAVYAIEQKEETPPKEWEVRGFSAALRDPLARVAFGRFLRYGSPRFEKLIAGAKADLNAYATANAARMLEGSEAFIRLATARLLGFMGASAKEHVALLLARLEDDHSAVRADAVWALGSVSEPTPPVVEALAARLEDPNGIVRATAVDALGNLGEHGALVVQAVAKRLEDPNPTVREKAARVLGSVGEAAKDQVPSLIKRLKDLDHKVAAAANYALGRMGELSKDHVDAIAILLRDPDSRVRGAGVYALGEIGIAARAYVPQLGELLSDPDAFVRSGAVSTLGRMGEAARDHIRGVVELLRDPDFQVRDNAARALGELGAAARPYLPEIAKLLDDQHPDARAAGGEALLRMGDPAKEHLPRVLEQLHDREPNVRLNIVQSLGSLMEAGRPHAAAIAKLCKDPVPNVRAAAVRTLGSLKDTTLAIEIARTLRDAEPDVRAAAAEALGRLGEGAAPYARHLVKLLDERDESVRMAVGQALLALGPFGVAKVIHILRPIYDDSYWANDNRALAHMLGGGDPEVETLLAWLGRPFDTPMEHLRKDHSSALNTLQVFKKTWGLTHRMPEVRQDLERRIAQVVRGVDWALEDRPVIEALADRLGQAGSPHADTLRQTLHSLERTRWIIGAGEVGLVHLLFWLTLVLAYPRFPSVQAFFFWNRWGRRFVGFGYVGFALTWVPYLRSKLFEPFRDSLCADAALDSFDAKAYFPDSYVRTDPSGPVLWIPDAIPKIRGQIILEGESGLGKTLLLRNLVKRSKRVVVFLRADRCEKGVLAAIQMRLHGAAQDYRFLQKLIYSGAIDVCIDGLNEVSADTRARITEFAESYFKGNIIMATQPLEWRTPSTARTYCMEPLTRAQMETFLTSRENSLAEAARLQGEEYVGACRIYLTHAFDERQPQETLKATERILSNPMDLTVVAQMLARGDQPDLFHLEEQQFHIMSQDYQRVNFRRAFPLEAFSERVYQMRLKDEVALLEGAFESELECMERYKMVVVRQSSESEGGPFKEWHFRHDKIMDFFIVQTFLGNDNSRPKEHMGDPRFRGVYLQLVFLLNLEDAERLEVELSYYAADTKDHSVSDTFIQLLRSRKAA